MADVPWMGGVHRSGNDHIEITDKVVLGPRRYWNTDLGDGGIVWQRRPVLCPCKLSEKLINDVLGEVLDGFGVITTRVDEPCFGRVGTIHVYPLCLQ